MNQDASPLPSFLRVLRGIWLFTWKSQLTWRKLPVHLVLLLSLPVLVYLTTAIRTRNEPSPFARRIFSTDPESQFRWFSRSLGRAGEDLTPEQEDKLRPIFIEELTAATSPADDKRESEPTASEQRANLKAAYERIGKRSQEILTQDQMSVFDNFVRRRSREIESAATQRAWTNTNAYFHWIVDFYLFVILPLACVNASGALIRDELQADTLGFLLTRPVSRARLLLTKYLCQTAWLQITVLVEALLLVLAGRLQHIQELGAFLALLLGIQFLSVFAWSALGVLLGQLTKRYLALAVLYGLIVERGIGNIPTNINTLSITRHLKTLLACNSSVTSIYGWSNQDAWLAVLALIVAAALFLGAAVGLFTYVEYHHTSEAQK